MNHVCLEDKIRGFVAITPETDLLKKLSEIVNNLKKEPWAKEVRWIRENNIHVTLRFLGDVKKESVPKILAALKKDTFGTSGFDFTPSRIVLLPSPSKPRVIAVEIDSSEFLSGLAEQVEKAVISCGFEPEKRRYRGHITIGRCRKTFPQKQYVQYKIEGAPGRVTEIALMQSELKPDGAVYSCLGRIPLATNKNE